MNNEYVNSVYKQLDDEAKKIEIKFYHATKKDNWISEEENEPGTVCAKSVFYVEDNSWRYYVKRCGCEFFDNTHISPVYHKRLWKLAPVSKQAFDLYITFLGFGAPCKKGQKYLKLKGERTV